ncbi:hypothetical protein ACLBNB_20105 [Pseudomonas chlororaphis subsp. aurantiaca]|uniref:hypothetical protein n=1 Tax=Pseudomonas chlororaphis TaxID=587753 RepID=UPI00398A6EF4
MIAIKERPILFSAPMVRAILEGRKTVTRRVMKFQPGAGASVTVERYCPTITDRHGYEQPGSEVFGAWWQDGECSCKSPYGQPGDRLWVRETHADIGCRLTYRADTDDGAHCQVKKWTPAIHMFRRDSRILLEITDVRVERLQDINEEQAQAEGVEKITLQKGWPQAGKEMWAGYENSKRAYLDTAVESFGSLWSSINGIESWNANPWVWVVEFRRVQP